MFTQLTGALVMTVSPTGLVSAPDTLAAATYTVTGTMKDSSGGTGNWTFTLVVECNLEASTSGFDASSVWASLTAAGSAVFFDANPQPSRRRTSKVSRRASPTKLNATTVTITMRPAG